MNLVKYFSCLKNTFFSDFNNKGMADEDFRNAPKVWNRDNTNNLDEYEDFYSIIDVLLLSDVFKKYRKIFTKISWSCKFYYSSYNFYECLLWRKKVELEL